MAIGGVTTCDRSRCWDGYTLCQSRFEQSARLIDLEGKEVSLIRSNHD